MAHVSTEYCVWCSKRGKKALASTHDTAEQAEQAVQFNSLHFPNSVYWWNSRDKGEK